MNKIFPEKDKMLKEVIGRIERAFGKGAIMKLGEADIGPVEVIPSGILPLDIALGVGGFPRGRIVEIFGPEASGKTTLALHLIASTQKIGGIAAFIDVEHALDIPYARNVGVDIDKLVFSQPDYGEQALEILEELVRSGVVDVVVVDSVAALVPQAELEGSMGDAHVGLQARLMSQALRKLTAFIGKTKSIVVFINQIRDKVAMGFQGGPAETTTGGRALKFYASIRLEVRKGESIRKDQALIGARVKAKVVKNKVAPPFKEAEFDIIYGIGVPASSSVLEAAISVGIVRQSGSWYYLGEERLGQGKDAVKEYLEANPALLESIEKMVLDKIRERKRVSETESSKKEVLFEEGPKN